MSFNSLMHPRNIYRVKPDYLQLGEKYPTFKDILTFYKNGKAKLNFNDPQALKILTITLLDNDFNLKVDLPLDRLIPAVPQRLNYVLWIDDLLSLLDLPPYEAISGVDIGTGACCIFPLLGCTINKLWTFIATEADEVAHRFAVENVYKNQLSHKIKVIKVPTDIFLLNIPNVTQMEAHFIMCNPPFFNDRSFAYGINDGEIDVDEPMSDQKSPSPASSSSGRPSPSNLSTPIESVTLGGEVEFVKKIIEESLILKESIKIYTVMLGHKKSSVILHQHLKGINEVKDVSVNQFFQGRTLRWGLAWTFSENLKLSESIKFAEIKKHHKKNIPLTYVIPKNLATIHYSLQSIYRRIRHLLRDELEILNVDIIRESSHSIEMIIHSHTDSWSHQRRRKRMAARTAKSTIGDDCTITQTNSQSDSRDENQDDQEMETDNNTESLTKASDSQRVDETLDHEFEKNINLGKRKAEDLVPGRQESSKYEESKKVRDERQIKSIVKEEELYLLHCSLKIRRSENDFIVLEMKTKEKAKSKDSTNQLLTFFKNNIN